jgi:hypothetical protein
MDYLYYHPLIVEGGRDRATDRKNTQERTKVATDKLKVAGHNRAEFSIITKTYFKVEHSVQGTLGYLPLALVQT